MTSNRFRSAFVMGLLWLYFAGAFVAGYWLLFVLAGVVRGQRGVAWMAGHYLRVFLRVARLAVRGLRIDVHERDQLRKTAGSVVVCNHISFLDPLLMLAFIPSIITVVRKDFFRVPFFGWLLRGAGFLEPRLFAEGQPWIDRVARHLRSGGNLLIFPEGTRSRDGQLSRFKKGAFYLAKTIGASILVLKVTGTDGVFPPGQWAFNLNPTRPIEIRTLACIGAAEAAEATTHELTERVFGLLGGG
jgi:1-acyl-sn-glycerol-3-phosphate acyltransferase